MRDHAKGRVGMGGRLEDRGEGEEGRGGGREGSGMGETGELERVGV